MSNFQFIGSSRAVAGLSIGTVVLDPIKFNVSSGLTGLNSFNTQPTVINSVDVLGGTPDYISLGISVTIYNPANLNLGVGDLYLELFNQGQPIGTTLLPNLNLIEGVNTLSVTSNFTPNANAQGLATLNQFVGGKPTALTISGYENSTAIDSLLLAFESLAINTTLPGLNTSLLNASALEVLTTTGYTNNISHVTVNIDNPFTTALDISYVNASVSAFGIPLGTVGTGTNFTTGGKAITTSPPLDIVQNLDPPSLFTILRVLAVQAGLPTVQLDGIMVLGGYSYLPAKNTSDGNATISTIETRGLLYDIPALPMTREELGVELSLGKRDNIYTGFNLPTFVDKSFNLLKADIELITSVGIGGYETTLTYSQLAVPVKTDASLNLLLPVLARPIVQKIVNGSILGFDTILISNAKETSFDVAISGAITNAGPCEPTFSFTIDNSGTSDIDLTMSFCIVDAVISFPAGLTVAWNGSPLGSIAMPNVTLVADVGAALNLSAAFTVSDTSALADFTKVLLTNETFVWDIYGTNLSIAALGIDIGLVSFNKTVSLKGFNGLKNGVVVNSFDLPENDPLGGIHLTLNTTVTNPSQVGIALSNISFVNFFHTTFVGPVAAEAPFTLSPSTSIDLALAGRLVSQNGSEQGLADIGAIFTNCT